MSNKYEKISLEELGILGDDVYNPIIYDESNIDSLHREVDKQVHEGCYLEKVRFYNKGDKVKIATDCSPGVKPIAGNTMYITECIYGDKPYQDCYKVSQQIDDGIFWVVCHSDIEGKWKEYEWRPVDEIHELKDPIFEECVKEGTSEKPSLSFTFKTGDDKPIIPVKECIHTIELKSFKHEFVTYCTSCGKIFSTKKKRK